MLSIISVAQSTTLKLNLIKKNVPISEFSHNPTDPPAESRLKLDNEGQTLSFVTLILAFIPRVYLLGQNCLAGVLQKIRHRIYRLGQYNLSITSWPLSQIGGATPPFFVATPKKTKKKQQYRQCLTDV